MRTRGVRAFVAAAVLACATAPPVAAEAQRPLDELLEEVRTARDDVDPGVFDEIAAHRDLDGFRTLQQAVLLVKESDLMLHAYGLFAAYRDSDLEPGVVAWLYEHASTGGAVGRRRAATLALCGFGGAALEEMRALLEGHPDEGCRRIAVGGLVPMLQAQRTPEALTTLLNWYRVGVSGSRETGLRAIAAFRSEDCLDLLREALRDKAVPAATKALVAGALGRMGTAASIALVTDALDDPHPTVSLAAIRALGECGHRSHDRILARLERAREPAVRREAIVARSAYSTGEEWEEHVERARRSRDYALRMGAAIALERLGSARAIEALHSMLDDASHLVRGEVIECLARIGGVESVAALVGALEGETLRLERRICDGLEALTGLSLGSSGKRWRSWWAAEGATFVLPGAGELAAKREERARRSVLENRTVAAFYGISIDSDRICFVLDTSGSMGGSKLELLREEMNRTLARMSDGGRFNLVYFADRARKWKSGLQELDDASRSSARRSLASRRAAGATALFNGLAEGLEDIEVDTIILLSDGMPSAGRFVGSEQILDEVRRRNALRGVVIHAVSLGGRSSLLHRLAEQTGGVYREVR
ncbi:MAG: HEAT repeat domain-containing protein [Planctomycetota bacterium]|nr:HEAT repeat domain-containing protein [Planctomycetota bacterium]MDP6763229.1 HEAT repeat domain-containing protein [Planctomycetota bacterium]MDP6990562.1 HEAT repeat domain-containing protein [Planctomycetota bacterium]